MPPIQDANANALRQITLEPTSFLEKAAPRIGAGATIALTLAYVWGFHGQEISADASKWGAFGDYFGGLLNPLFGFFTLLVAVRVLSLQRSELHETKQALQQAAATADLQFQLAWRSQCEATYASCLKDVDRAIELVASASRDKAMPPIAMVDALSANLEMAQPLIELNSHAVSFMLRATGYEAPLPLSPWDWTIHHGNDARELLRLMLPLCRSVGDALAAIHSMPATEHDEKFRRFRNALGERQLSTFAYFLVLHPDGHQYVQAAEAAHVLTNLRLQRARGFAEAYLPAATYTLPS